jgi:hypothetical protein
MMSIDGVGGVAENDSSFVPIASELKSAYFSVYCKNCLNFLHDGFAFKICDSLNSCAPHKSWARRPKIDHTSLRSARPLRQVAALEHHADWRYQRLKPRLINA